MKTKPFNLRLDTRTRIPMVTLLVAVAQCTFAQPAEARILNSNLGRWMQRDPAGFVDGPNLYGYVSAAPTNFTDPQGENEMPLKERWRRYNREYEEWLAGREEWERHMATVEFPSIDPADYEPYPPPPVPPPPLPPPPPTSPPRSEPLYKRGSSNPYGVGGPGSPCQYVWDSCDNGEGWGHFCSSCCSAAVSCGLFNRFTDCMLARCGEQFGYGQGIDYMDVNSPGSYHHRYFD